MAVDYSEYSCQQFNRKYEQIQKKLRAARADADMAKIKRANRELERWQDAYGAYAPIKC